MRINKEEGNPARIVVSKNGDNDQIVATVKSFPFLTSNREFVVRFVHAKDAETGNIAIAQETVNETVDYGKKMRKVRGFTRVLFSAVPVAHDRSKVTLVQVFDAGGHIPVWLINRSVPKSLNVVNSARKEFQRDEEIDKEARNQLAVNMQWKENITDRGCDSDEEKKTEVRGASLGG